MRVGVQAAGCIGNLHLAQQGLRHFVGLGPGLALVNVHGLGDLQSHGQRRVERTHGLLENHGDAVATDGAHGFVVELEQIPPLEQDFAGLDAPRRGGDQPHQRQRRDTLARARFADDGQRLTGVDRKRHVIDRRDLAALCAKAGGQATDFKQRLRHVRSPFSFSAPGRSRFAHGSGQAGQPQRAIHRRSFSPRATRPCRCTRLAGRCGAPCPGSRAPAA